MPPWQGKVSCRLSEGRDFHAFRLCISINFSGCRLSDVRQFWQVWPQKYFQMPLGAGSLARSSQRPSDLPGGQKSQVACFERRSPKSGRFYQTILEQSERCLEHETSDWVRTQTERKLVCTDSVVTKVIADLHDQQATSVLPFAFRKVISHGDPDFTISILDQQTHFGAWKPTVLSMPRRPPAN